MGYNLTERMVHTYADALEIIRVASEKGNTAAFDCPKEHLSAERYRLREALKSAEAFPHLYDGRYATLAKQVTVKVKVDLNQLHVIPESGMTYRLTPPDERKAIESLDDIQSNMHILEFYPSTRFDEDYFVKVAARRGWRVHAQAKTEEGGKVSYPVERIKQERGKTDRGFSTILED
jgi:hypothetical protein